MSVLLYSDIRSMDSNKGSQKQIKMYIDIDIDTCIITPSGKI